MVVSNAVGAGPTFGPVTVTETLPPGMTLVSMAGAGWYCTGNTCTRNDMLPGGTRRGAMVLPSLYPAIIVTLNVAATATSPQSNSVSVSWYPAQTFTSSLSTNIVTPPATLSIISTHRGDFQQSEEGTYTLTVTNSPNAGSTQGVVEVTELLPTGLTLVSMAGAGWTCSQSSGGSCTRSDALAPGQSYPPITMTVSVTFDAPSPAVNVVAVYWGSSSQTATESNAIHYRYAPC